MSVLESLIKAQRIERLISKQYEIAMRNMILSQFDKEHELNQRIKEACLKDQSHTKRLSQ
jgi:hypothetical protein